MDGVTAVKHIAIPAKSRPPKNASGMASSESGRDTTPKAASTGSIRATYIVLRVAPQRSSPAITSSIESGVAMMASKLFW